jgi:alanyl-tRNA synthetase
VGDCQKNGDNHCHIGRVLGGALSVGDDMLAGVDNNLRQAIVLNHSATHLLHAALRNVLGDHVTQKGSLVDSEKLRFDFAHFEAVTHQELKMIEQQVNDEIRRNTATDIEVCSMDNAKDKGAMMLFGEKYGTEVRVLNMGDGYSVELCGGTHVERTGDIGLCRIVSESGVAAGVRRIEAVTGKNALQLINKLDQQMQAATQVVKANPSNLLEKLEQLMALTKEQDKQLASLQAKMASAASGDLLSQVKEVAGINILACVVEGANAKSLRELADSIKSKLASGVFLLAAVDGEKVALIAGVTKDLIPQFKAGDLMRAVAPLVGGKGGGRPDMAQGAGTNIAGINDALAFVEKWVAAS